ncbi:MAG: type II toxin-antitoxin system VapC family toxin [Micrococcales bacterium]|nr:type II toxin-antitoxin system VapC family toxin [Micrococcales bacterium]
MILVDSDVVISLLRGDQRAVVFWEQAAATEAVAVSVVTLTEVMGGMRSSERRAVARLFAELRLEPVTETVAHRAGQLMRQYRASHGGIGIADYLIAATAECTGASLATLNVRHYPMFEGLKPAFPMG